MNINKNENIIGICALFVHAAKIDENYTDKEKKIILDYIKIQNIDNLEADKILIKSEKIESDSNQLINYTNIIKKNSEKDKAGIIEQLWKILISDNSVDQYESNLMRRICGLIYFSDKLSGEIKLKILDKKNDIHS
jgi:uncharacterized tellurite resistance protein B-like protein|tara:strand:- start:1049 stop:1456 length:408 start_codon:yes stop_codon:yes gene_type:complete